MEIIMNIMNSDLELSTNHICKNVPDKVYVFFICPQLVNEIKTRPHCHRHRRLPPEHF